MKFEAEKEQLVKSLLISDSIITSKNVNTILSNCCFNVFNDSIVIVSTDNEIGIKTSLKVKADGNFSFCINGKKLISILKEIPKGDVIISVDEKFNVHISNKNLKGNYSLVGLDKGEFPEMPSYSETNLIEFEQLVLKDIIRKVSYAAATDSIKPSFCGVFIISEEKGKITSVATDSKRLSLVMENTDTIVKLNEGIIIPLKTVHEVSRLLSTQGKCFFSVGKNQCFFKIGDTEIISRLIDGQFPNYKQVIPKEYKIKVCIEKNKLIETLRRMMIFTREPSYKVVIHIKKDSMKIETKTSDLGEAAEEILISSNSDERITIGISAQFLLESIKEIDTDDIEIKIMSNISPILLSPKESNKEIAVIMPIQTKSDQEE